MSNDNIRVLGDVEISKSLSFKENYSAFPANPKPRTLIVKDGQAYIYTELVNGSGYFSWTPVGVRQNSYLHTQGLESTTWTVTHGLNVTDFAYFVYDNDHSLVLANSEIIDANTIQINLAEAITGTVVVFGLDHVTAPGITAVDNVTINTIVLRDASGTLTVNNNAVAFAGAVDSSIAAIQAEIDGLSPSALTSGGNDIVAVDVSGATVSGNLIPSANVTYSLGDSTHQWKDLWLSGSTINLGGAVIKTDASSGAVAIIPQVTSETPNPVGIVISSTGSITPVTTAGGVISAGAIAASTADTAQASATVQSVTALGERIDAILTNTDATALNSLTELVAAFQAADGNLTSSISSLSSTASSNLAAEITNRVAAVTAAINTAAADATTKANGAQAAAISIAAADATTKASAAQTAAIAAAAADATTKVAAEETARGTAIATAKSEAISTAAADATTKVAAEATARGTAIATAKSEAISTAAADATTKANAAQAAAISAAATDATTKVATEATARASGDTTNADAIAAEVTRATAAEALLAPKASPTFTGVPAAPTATAGTSTTQLATTAFVAAVQTVAASDATTKANAAQAAAISTAAADATTKANAAQAAAISTAAADATTKANAAQAAAISAVTNGAGAAFDTLKEIQDAMATDTELAAAIAAISNVPSATKLQTARTIQGVAFDGTAAITVVTAGTGISVSGTAVSSTETLSSITARGATTSAAISTGAITVTGSPVTALINGGTAGTGNIGASGAGFNTVFAKATSATYADLAENYVGDTAIEPGTVVEFGGEKEVTICGHDMCTRVAGVVSTNPAYLMNGELSAEHIIAVAFTGRVPCKVVGAVRKGDLMVSAGNGAARANNEARAGTIIGKALENFDGVEGTIEVVVGRF